MEFQAKIDKEAVNLLPVLEYPDRRTVVVDKLLQVEQACVVLSSYELIGFDTETKPSFTKGMTHKVALVQLATLDTCYLFRVNLLGIPKALSALLANPKVMKVGVSLHDDFRSLSRRSRITPMNCLDLQQVVRQVGIEEMSLQKIYAIVFGKKISKAQRLTNWEVAELTDKQQMYAAIDAWACIDIYNRIKDGLQKNLPKVR